MTAPVLAYKKFWIVKPKAGRNYIKNPRFDKPDGVEDWTANGAGVTIELTGDYARRGAYSLQVNTATGIASSTYYDNASVTSGLDYTFSVDIKGVEGQAMRIVIADSTHAAKATKTFTATGYWQRVEVTLTAAETKTDYELWVTRDAVASTAVFYVDGAQFEQESKATTFIHGYGAGCKWDGAIRNSDSIRSAYTGLGGELLDLDDYCHVVRATGLGHGDWNQIVTKMTSGGDLYQDYIRKSRQFSIVVDFIGNSLGEIETNRKTLIDALRPDLLDGAKVDEQFGINWGSDVRPHGERIVRYQGFAANGDEATNPIDIRCVPLPNTLTDTPDLPTYQRAVLNFSVPSGLLDGAYNEGTEMELYAEFPAEYIVKRDPDGNWCTFNSGTGEYENPLAGVNGTVYDIKEAPNGDIYVCGAFTSVSNGGIAVANTKGIARWSKANQQWEAVGDPETGATIVSINTMIFDANGDLYTGGYFTNLANIADADYFAKYTVSTDTWSAVGSGINGEVNAIEIVPNGTIYIGGAFASASGDTNCNYVAYLYAAPALTWKPLATGLNSGVTALKYHGNFLLIGGTFTEADGTNGDYICYWDGTAFKSFYDLGATELNDSVFSIDVNQNGIIIIGGTFTNAGGDPNADYVAAWRGNNWGSLMAGGVNNTVYKVYCADNGIIYLAGSFTTAGSLTLTDRVVKSVQGAYQPLDVDLPGTAFLQASCLASDGSLYLGGWFSTIAQTPDENAKTGVVALNLNVASASANTYPYIQIHGPGTLKSIVNYSTGANVSFNGLTLQAGEWVSFSFDPVSLKFQGGWTGRGNLLRYVNAGSDYGNFYLKPGANNISLFMDGTDSNSSAMIMWTPKFWGIDGALLE